MDYCSILPQWLTAIGTIAAVIIALFQKIILDWINRPKILMSYIKNKKPCHEIINSDVESDNGNSQLRIRIKLENKGKSIAKDAALYVDCYYKKIKDEEKYVSEELTRKQIKDFQRAKQPSIAPHLLYYYEVGAINKYENKTTQNNYGKVKQFYKLYLLGEGEPLELGTGTFIIPLKFYSSSIDVQTAYLRVFWVEDTDLKIDKYHFDAEMITEKDFENKYRDKIAKQC